MLQSFTNPDRVEGTRSTAAGKRPKLSLASLIGQAILSSPGQKARLGTIYEWISTRYPDYYKMNCGGWQNSIRHNLTINKAFVKAPKSIHDAPGKGSFWSIHEDHIDDFRNGVFVGKARSAEYRHKSKRREPSYVMPPEMPLVMPPLDNDPNVVYTHDEYGYQGPTPYRSYVPCYYNAPAVYYNYMMPDSGSLSAGDGYSVLSTSQQSLEMPGMEYDGGYYHGMDHIETVEMMKHATAFGPLDGKDDLAPFMLSGQMPLPSIEHLTSLSQMHAPPPMPDNSHNHHGHATHQ